MAQPTVSDSAVQNRPRLTAAQWEQVRRLIADLEQARSGSPEDCQRGADRSPVEFPVRVSVMNQRDVEGNGWAVARNISRGGLSVLSRPMVHPGTVVTVELPTPSGPPRRIIARVVRCRYVSDLYHELGISFVESAH